MLPFYGLDVAVVCIHTCQLGQKTMCFHHICCFVFFSYGLGTVSGRVRACHGTYNKGFTVSERVRVVPE